MDEPKLELLRKDYLNLLKRCNLKEENNKASFRDRFDFIIERSASGKAEHVYSTNLWNELIKDFPYVSAKQSLDAKVDDISKNLKANPPLHGHSIFINNLIKAYGLNLSEEIYFNVFPTNDFNASAHCTENGHIVLLNRGVIKLIHNVIYNSFYLISDQYLTSNNKTAFEKKVTAHTIKVIAEYLLSDQHKSFFVDRYELDLESFYSAFYLIGAVKNFIVGHEVAHVLLGHSAQGNIKNIIAGSRENVEVISKSHAQEFEADDLAQRLLIFSDQNNLSFPSIGGGIAFLLLDLMVLSIHSKLSNNPKLYYSDSESHPSAIERIKKLDQLIQRFDYEPIKEGLANCTVLQKQLSMIKEATIKFDQLGTLKILF